MPAEPDNNMSFEDQIKDLDPNVLKTMLQPLNRELGFLGVTLPVSIGLYGARMYGARYEDRRRESGVIRISPMNLMVSILHKQPDLLNEGISQYEELASCVSKIAMISELLIKKTGKFDLPEDFHRSPQSVLPE